MHLQSFLVILLNLSLLLSFTASDSFADEASSYEADVIKVRELFESRRFQELTSLLEKYQTSCEQDIRWEFSVQDAFNVFDVTQPSYRMLIVEWVQASPKSWVPLIAQANYYYALGWKARGGKYASETSEEQIRQMRDNFAVTVQDTTAALRINPRLCFAYDLLMKVNQAEGNQDAGALLVRKALASFPDSYLIRYRHMMSLTPRWGGSYKKMEQFALEEAPYVKKNPMIKTLPGFVFWDQASMADLNKQPPRAIELYEKALTYGENWNFLYDLANVYFRNQMSDKALQTVVRAIALRPSLADGYVLRCAVHWELRKFQGALDDCTHAIGLNPYNANAFLNRGGAKYDVNDFKGALGDYDEAIRLDPYLTHAYIYRCAVKLQLGRLQGALDDCTHAIDLDPRNAYAFRNRGLAKERMNDFQGALGDYDEAIRLAPDVKTYCNRGRLRSQREGLGNYLGAWMDWMHCR